MLLIDAAYMKTCCSSVGDPEADERVPAMTDRRNFLQKSSVLVAAPLLLPACAKDASTPSYDDAVRATWRHAEAANGIEPSALMHELVRYATLAPSSHNTQCWKFAVGRNEISVLPDLTRRCPVVDPDDHHLFVSLGCATENLLQAARAYGYASNVRVEGGTDERVRVMLERTNPERTPLFAAIPLRQCTRTEYDGKAIANEELRLLERAGTGNGVRVLLLTGTAVREKVLEYVIQGNTRQLSDTAFVAELKDWIRFGDREAILSGDGLSARASGNPSVPRWLGSVLFKLVVSAKGENDKYAKQVRSSAGIAVFVSDVDDEAHWVEAGRCYQRFALQATALGIRNAFLNQPVELADLRPQFAHMLAVGQARPDLVVRFGRGPEMQRSLRRPLQAVIV